MLPTHCFTDVTDIREPHDPIMKEIIEEGQRIREAE
jgi:hypothetical protein